MNNPYHLHKYKHVSECIYCGKTHVVVFDKEQMHLEACLPFVQMYESIYDNYIERVNKYSALQQVSAK